MKKLNKVIIALSAVAFATSAAATETAKKTDVYDLIKVKSLAEVRMNLAKNTESKGFGPQSPRDIDSVAGSNTVVFAAAPAYSQMNLCNIHFHTNAEHKGGDFTTYAGRGNNGVGGGFKFNGKLPAEQLKPTAKPVCAAKGKKGLVPGDTIEVHYVHSTAAVKPGPTLGACLSPAIKNPQLRVETQVMVLANDTKATSFIDLAAFSEINGFQQAYNIPDNTGKPVVYAGSTTGPDYNEQGSPFQVTWSVRPRVIAVDINSVGTWCEGNEFNEDHAHGVRNLVKNKDLLSPIAK